MYMRNIHVAEIIRALERLSDSKMALPAHAPGSSRRRGSAVDFLDDLEEFYKALLPEPFNRLRFNVQHSGHAWDRISATLGRV